MKKQPLRQLIPFAILTALMCPVMADETPAPSPNIPAAAARTLNTEGARMVEIRNYLTGLRDTQVFLVLAEQDAAVRLRNRGQGLPGNRQRLAGPVVFGW